MIPFRDGTKPCVYEMDRIWERDSELAKDSDSPEKSSDRASSGFVSVWYYFAPLAVVMLSYILAAYNAYKYGAVLDLKNTTW